jgi:methionine-rich copper-binding protein CopC
MRRGLALAASLLLFASQATSDAAAHAGLAKADPAASATLGASPTAVKLTFSERPQASLAEIAVRDKTGKALQFGRPQTVAGEPLTLSVPVEKLPRGVYTVGWRVVSAIDGHASSGAFAFGVNASPRGARVAAPALRTSTSALEVVARWLLLSGLALLLGAAVALRGTAVAGETEAAEVAGAVRSALGSETFACEFARGAALEPAAAATLLDT